MDDSKLLTQYCEQGDQEAFTSLVRRHIDLVHSAALRQCDGDEQRAREITQMVFTDLATKARELSRHPLLLGWLHRATFLHACKLRRGEARRKTWENAAALEQAIADQPGRETEWSQLRPVIDEALANLSEIDRQSILQRVLEERSFAELGQALGVSENSARMRFNRALERLQHLLAKRGIHSTASALALALAGNTVHAAPAGLAAAVSRQALLGAGGAAGAGGLMQTLLAHKLSLGTTALLSVSLGFLWTTLLAQERLADKQMAKQVSAIEAMHTQVSAKEFELSAKKAKLNTLDQSLEGRLSAAQRERYSLDLLIRKGELDRYHYLFRRLKLSKEKLSMLKTLLVQRDQQRQDALAVAKKAGLEPLSPGEMDSLLNSATVESEGLLLDLLGDAGYGHLRNFEQNGSWISLLCETPDAGALGMQLQRSEEEYRLIDEKAAQLASLLKACAPTMDEDRYYANDPLPYPQNFMTEAEKQLSPAQFASLLRANQRHNRETQMNRIVREAAYAGKLKLGRSDSRAYGLKSADKKDAKNTRDAVQ